MTRAFVPAERTQSTRCRASRIPAIIAAKIYSSTPRVVSSHIRVLDVGWVIVTRARAFLEGALLSLASMVSPRTSGSARGSLAAVLSFVALVSASAVAGDGDPASAFPTATDRGFAAWLARVGGELSEEVVLAHVEGGGRGVFAKDAALENGDEVFSVPADAALVVPSRRAGKAINDLARADPEWALAVQVIRERHHGAATPHAPFLAALFDHPRPPGSCPPRHRPARPSSPGAGLDNAAAADRNPAAAGVRSVSKTRRRSPSAVAALGGAPRDASSPPSTPSSSARTTPSTVRSSAPPDGVPARSIRPPGFRARSPSSAPCRAFPRAADVRRVGDRTPREAARGARPGRAPPRATRAAPSRASPRRFGGRAGPALRGAAEGSNDGRSWRAPRGGGRGGFGATAAPRRPSPSARVRRGGRRRVGLGRREMTDAEAFARFGTVGAGATPPTPSASPSRREDDDDEEAEEAAPGMSSGFFGRQLNASSSFARRTRAARRGLVAAVRRSTGWRSSPTGPRRAPLRDARRHRQ